MYNSYDKCLFVKLVVTQLIGSATIDVISQAVSICVKSRLRWFTVVMSVITLLV